MNSQLILLYVILCFYSISGVISNGLIIGFYPFHSKSTTLANVFIKVLAYTDLFTCLVVIPLILYLTINTNYMSITCKIYICLIYFGIILTILTKLSVTIERWFATFKPYLFTKKFIYTINTFNIIISGIMGLLASWKFNVINIGVNDTTFTCVNSDKNKTKEALIGFLVFWIFHLIEIFIYTSIFIVISNKIKSRRNNIYENFNNYKLKKQLRAATMLFGVTVIYLLTWIPNAYSDITNVEIDINIKLIIFINNFINCYIYLSFQKKFRQNIYGYFFQKFSCLLKHNQPIKINKNIPKNL